MRGPAFAVRSVLQPTNLPPGGAGTLSVLVTNVGAASTNGEPVRILDTLPPGLTVTSVNSLTEEPGESKQPCEQEAARVTCTFSGELAGDSTAGLELYMEVAVAGDAGGTLSNTAVVSGGGASPVSATEPVVVSAQEPAFALDGSFEASAFDLAGALDTQAGGHPETDTTGFVLNSVPKVFAGASVAPVQELKDVSVELPPGLIGDPEAAASCPGSQVAPPNDGVNCPAASIVGTVAATTQFNDWHLSGPLNGAETTKPLFNVTPDRGHPAQFAFIFSNQEAVLYADLVHTPAGYQVRASSPDIIPEAHLTGIKVTFFGDPAERDGDANPHVPFFTNPTDCDAGPLTTTIDFDSWQHPASLPLHPDGSPDLAAANFAEPQWQQASSESPAVTGCENLQFKPEFEATPTTRATGSPTGLNTELRIPQDPDPAGLATPELKDTTVTLPQGVVLSPSQANGLQACSNEQIALESSEPGSCPRASQVGSVSVHTPILEKELHGQVFLGAPECDPCTDADAQDGRLARLFLQVHSEEYGVTVKIPGNVSINPSTGRLTATFEQTPQLPVDEIQLDFPEGPRAALSTPTACATYTSAADFTPWSAPYTPDAKLSPSFTIDEGCSAPGFAPAFAAGTVTPQAGGYSPFTLSFARNDSEQDFNALEATLPPGLLAKLAGVARCGAAEANAGTCPESARIGTVTVGAGPGADPYYVTGQVYLTGPYNGGPFGEVVEVPAVAGPFNLGTVVVRGSIRINPTTAQATVVSNPFPTILDGIPLQVKTVEVTLNREGFTFNPTSCNPAAVTAKLMSTQGAAAGVSAPFQAVNCAALAFKPSFTLSVRARTSKARGASLAVKVIPAAGQANIAKVSLEFPKQLPARLTTLQKACTAAQFEANPAGCPAASDIGTAKAVTPILSTPLEGPAYLVSHGGAAFPDVEFILQGEGVTIDLDGKTQIKHGLIYSHFETIPDAPIASFETVLPEGPYSVLATDLPAKARYSLCGQSLSIPTTLTAQNGAVVKQTTKASIRGCPKLEKKAATKKTKKASKSTRRGG